MGHTVKSPCYRAHRECPFRPPRPFMPIGEHIDGEQDGIVMHWSQLNQPRDGGDPVPVERRRQHATQYGCIPVPVFDLVGHCTAEPCGILEPTNCTHVYAVIPAPLH